MTSDKASSRKQEVPQAYAAIRPLVQIVAPLDPQDWWLPAIEKVRAEFDYTLRLPAACLAVSAPRALDYVRTAPVLALMAKASIEPVQGGAHALVERFARFVDSGVKLPRVMWEMGTAPQLRALRAPALSSAHARVVAQLAELHPSTIAQIVPKTASEQQIWLTRLEHWASHASRRFSDDTLRFEWAARNLAAARFQEADYLAEIVDLIGQDPARFSPRWTFGRALQSAMRWHADLQSGKHAESFREHYKVDYEQPLDLGRFPLEHVEGGITFLALRSGKDLFEEGVAMHHCVASYFPDIVAGKSRIYSLRTGAKRTATLELCGLSAKVLQLKGCCNAGISDEVHKIVRGFARGVRLSLQAGSVERIAA